jgi:23S rRNA (adenine2503-C2)-methyltransferase
LGGAALDSSLPMWPPRPSLGTTGPGRAGREPVHYAPGSRFDRRIIIETHEISDTIEQPLTPLVGMDLPALRAWAKERGLPAFRAAQMYHGIYRRLAVSPLEMTDLPLALREQLAGEVLLSELNVVNEVRDPHSRTTKTLFALRDGALVESVLMTYGGHTARRRHTVCLSSQVGCALGCTFCATGLQGWARDLSAGEMVEQILYFARLLRAQDEQLTNIVYMGMGEPFLNYDAVLQSLRLLIDPDGFGLGARHLTVSTSGVVPAIRRFARENLQVGLAVSLHAPNDTLRGMLVPLNRRYGVAELIDACKEYTERTHRRISFEYTMLAGVNDGMEQAEGLVTLLRGMLCHVNLIPWNRVDGMPYHPTPMDAIEAFRDWLEEHGIATTIRDTRGSGISAACGQLRTATIRERRPIRPLPTV